MQRKETEAEYRVGRKRKGLRKVEKKEKSEKEKTERKAKRTKS